MLSDSRYIWRGSTQRKGELYFPLHCKNYIFYPPATFFWQGYLSSLQKPGSLFGWLVADGWCWFVLREECCWLVADGCFVLREKYCWLLADKPNEQAVYPL
jgi:hypothetical protein